MKLVKPRKPPIIVGIDPATQCGWAVRWDEKCMEAGSWKLAGKSKDGPGKRFQNFRHRLQTLLDDAAVYAERPEGEPDRTIRIYYEQVERFAGTSAAKVWGGWIAVLQIECEDRELTYQGIPVKTIKKRATGNGNARKIDMINAAAAMWKCRPVDDNEADARWIAECGYDLNRGMV